MLVSNAVESFPLVAVHADANYDDYSNIAMITAMM